MSIKLMSFVFLAVLMSGCQPEEEIVYVDRIVEVQPKAVISCDRGLDMPESECNQIIDDHTFWLQQKDIKATIEGEYIFSSDKTVNVETNVVYEFFPSEVKGKHGTFKRGVYFEDPNSNKVVGYMEVGKVLGLNHKKIDFQILSDSCSGVYAETAEPVKFSKYYVRNKNNLSLTDKEPQNIIEAFLFFGVRIFEIMVSVILDVLTVEHAEDIFREDMSLQPYFFSLEKLPVNWGCSVEGDFHLAPKIYLNPKFK